MFSRTFSRAAGAAVVIATAAARPGHAQIASDFTPLTTPSEAGHCVPARSHPAFLPPAPGLHGQRWVLTATHPSRRRELDVYRDATGRVVEYDDAVLGLIGAPGTVGEDVVWSSRAGGVTQGFWLAHAAMQDTTGHAPDVTPVEHRPPGAPAAIHHTRRPLDDAEKRRVHALVAWVSQRCPA